jgi:CRISPR-associated protein Cmr1
MNRKSPETTRRADGRLDFAPGRRESNMEIRIETRTPIWTGGVQTGKMNRIQETGIIGSLRWWYEAVLRGLGGKVCDPSRHECLFDKEKFEKAEGKGHRERLSEAGLCDACQLFGATGYRRRFQLRVADKMLPAWNAPPKSLRVQPPDRSGGWLLPPGHVGELALRFAGTDDALNRLANLFLFLEKWGTLGAKPQLGYGAFRIHSMTRKETKKCEPSLPPLAMRVNTPPGPLPDLRSFTFFKLRFSPKSSGWWHRVPGLQALRGQRASWSVLEGLAKRGMAPVTPSIRNHLRFGRTWSSHALPHWFFGTLKGNERIRSKISISWAYRSDDAGEWEIRGWAYLPRDEIGRAAGDEIRRVLRATIGNASEWLAMLGMNAADYRSAGLTYFPNSTPWRPNSVQEMEATMQNVFERRRDDS